VRPPRPIPSSHPAVMPEDVDMAAETASFKLFESVREWQDQHGLKVTIPEPAPRPSPSPPVPASPPHAPPSPPSAAR